MASRMQEQHHESLHAALNGHAGRVPAAPPGTASAGATAAESMRQHDQHALPQTSAGPAGAASSGAMSAAAEPSEQAPSSPVRSAASPDEESQPRTPTPAQRGPDQGRNSETGRWERLVRELPNGATPEVIAAVNKEYGLETAYVVSSSMSSTGHVGHVCLSWP
jgi:hypothetical protein